MNLSDLTHQIRKKKSFLCVGLDVDVEKMPPHLQKQEDPLFEFSKAIIDSTAPYAVAYKPNTAFFEAYGSKGWDALERVMKYLNEKHPEVFTIADAKRGDIGNTSKRYAKAFFHTMNFDAVTVAPYMGADSVEPFLAFEQKYAVLLALTSNKGANDFQFTESASGEAWYQRVIQTSQNWQNAKRLMYVVGATQAKALAQIREQIPHSFLLIPGVGAQGGDLETVARFGMHKDCGLLVNSSRGIMYASSEENFSEAAATAAQNLQLQMEELLKQKKII